MHYRARNGPNNSKKIGKGDLIEKEGDVQGNSFVKGCSNCKIIFPFQTIRPIRNSFLTVYVLKYGFFYVFC
jgi:hypothetical protein